jgi:hypothetical protein
VSDRPSRGNPDNLKGARGYGFKPGKSGNPGGYTKAQLAVRRLQADLVAEETDGGRQIIEFVAQVFRGQHKVCNDAKSLRWAADFLADRLWGRAPLTVTVKPARRLEVDDLKKMPLADLERELAELDVAALPEPETDDAPSGDVH